MGALLPLRATVYALVWAEVLQITYRLMVGGSLSWGSLIPSSSGLLIGFLSGVAFSWLQARYHWLLTALGLALLQAELVAWIGQYGSILGTLIPPTLLAAVAASVAAHRLSAPRNDFQIELYKLLTVSPTLIFLIPGFFGDQASTLNTVSTHHRTYSPDNAWVARVKRGGPLLSSQSDTVIMRLDRDWGSLFALRLGEYPVRSVTQLRWTDQSTVNACVVDGPTMLWIPLRSNAIKSEHARVASQ